jgi:hypothetical protein
MQLPTTNAITLTFGYHAGYPLNGGNHIGTDFSPSPDNTIYMPEDGQANCVAWDGKTNEGNVIYITSGNHYHALCHMSKFLVSSGFVKKGTPVGIMGDTGYADGVHLHWALKVNGTLVDPLSQVTEERQKMSTTDILVARILAYHILGRNGYDNTQQALSGDCDADLNKNHVGQETNAKIWEFYNSVEAKDWREHRLPNLYTDLNNYKRDVTDLRAQNDQLIKNNANLQAKLDGLASGDNIIITAKGWAALFAAIKSFFNKNS